jgi:hypothetical protein
VDFGVDECGSFRERSLPLERLDEIEKELARIKTSYSRQPYAEPNDLVGFKFDADDDM